MKASSTAFDRQPMTAFKTGLVLFLLLPLAACIAKADPNPRRATIDLEVGSVVFRTELARTETERSTGLMFRERIGEDEAMLFIFENENYRSFWMKNTKVYLSLAYIDATGTILEIHDLFPGDENPVPSANPARFALEVRQGAFGRRGVKIGDRINLDRIR